MFFNIIRSISHAMLDISTFSVNVLAFVRPSSGPVYCITLVLRKVEMLTESVLMSNFACT